MMTNFSMLRLLKPAMAAGALFGLGGCMYGAGYYGDGYVNNHDYACDPYAPFDDYYACDYGYGFTNIGFGGGWYDQYYYPGYGIYIFDRGGARHAMRKHHRRHWARQRAHYGERHGRYRDRRADRRAYRRDQGEYVRGERRRGARATGGRNVQRDSRTRARNPESNAPATRAGQPGRQGQAAPARNRGERNPRASRRPASAAEQPQSRQRPASRPPRVESPRHSPRSSRSTRQRTSDE